VDFCGEITSYILPQRSTLCTRQNIAEELIMKNNFDCRDMVYFLEEGFEGSQSIHYGIITQVNYASTEKSMKSIDVVEYFITAINHEGKLQNYRINNEDVYDTIDNLLLNLKNSYEPDFNLGSLQQLDRENYPMNLGYMEDLLDGYKEEMEWRLK